MAEQGVKPIESLEELAMDWPEEGLFDGFAEAVRKWRDEELELEKGRVRELGTEPDA